MQRGASFVSVLGGLLIAASIVAPAFGVTLPTFVPGFILLFVGRAMNRNRRRSPIPTSEGPVPSPPARNIPPRPAPDQRSQERVKPRPVPVESEPRKLEEVLEELDLDSDIETPPIDVTLPEMETETGPLSSAEMIARARNRWDKRP